MYILKSDNTSFEAVRFTVPTGKLKKDTPPLLIYTVSATGLQLKDGTWQFSFETKENGKRYVNDRGDGTLKGGDLNAKYKNLVPNCGGTYDLQLQK